MKKAILISTFSLLIFTKCTTQNQLNGTYSDAKSMEFKFNDSTKEFEYFLRSEMGILQYSKGSWELNKDKLYLSGLGDDNIKTIAVESTIESGVTSNRTQIEIQCGNNDAANIKSALVINDNKAYIVSKDTILTLDYKVETIHVKSYLSYTGLLSSSPKLDTLYSSKIDVGNRSIENKSIILKLAVHPYDFVRVKMTDTLTVKNSHTLYHKKTKLKKSTQ